MAIDNNLSDNSDRQTLDDLTVLQLPDADQDDVRLNLVRNNSDSSSDHGMHGNVMLLPELIDVRLQRGTDPDSVPVALDAPLPIDSIPGIRTAGWLSTPEFLADDMIGYENDFLTNGSFKELVFGDDLSRTPIRYEINLDNRIPTESVDSIEMLSDTTERTPDANDPVSQEISDLLVDSVQENISNGPIVVVEPESPKDESVDPVDPDQPIDVPDSEEDTNNDAENNDQDDTPIVPDVPDDEADPDHTGENNEDTDDTDQDSDDEIVEDTEPDNEDVEENDSEDDEEVEESEPDDLAVDNEQEPDSEDDEHTENSDSEDDESDEDDESEDHVKDHDDHGHGNDPDGHDDDNPGNGKPVESDDKEKGHGHEKDHEHKDHSDHRDDSEKGHGHDRHDHEDDKGDKDDRHEKNHDDNGHGNDPGKFDPSNPGGKKLADKKEDESDDRNEIEKEHRDNGHGNGDDQAPGNSLDHNSAENDQDDLLFRFDRDNKNDKHAWVDDELVDKDEVLNVNWTDIIESDHPEKTHGKFDHDDGPMHHDKNDFDHDWFSTGKFD